MAYASGSKAWGISDRSGRRYRLKDMRKEWTGALVGPDEYEPKQPQLFPPKAYPDPQALRNPRPEQVETKSKVLLQMNPFLVGLVDSNVLTVVEPGHGRTTGDRVRFSKAQSFQDFNQATLNRNEGYQITVTTADEYTITVNAPLYLDLDSPTTGDHYDRTVPRGILQASLSLAPHYQLLEVTQVQAGRSLGDVTGDNNGQVSVRDALDYLNWQYGTNNDAAEVQYIEEVMNVYMFNNYSSYYIYLQKSTIANSRGGGGSVSVEALQNNASNVRVSGGIGTTAVGSINVLIGATETTVTGVGSSSAVGTVTATGNLTATYVVTVASYGGSNRFYIDGVLQPTLSLTEGSTYLFNWSAATGHPLRFSTTSDGTHGGGSEYTTGVVKDDVAYTTQITVAVGAPTLYYYCQFHSGMGGQINT
jgi:hypothetical protein